MDERVSNKLKVTYNIHLQKIQANSNQRQLEELSVNYITKGVAWTLTLSPGFEFW